MSLPFWRGVSLLVGTIIGAGIFGIPYVTVQSGYLVGLGWLVGLTFLVVLTKLAYARVILSFEDHPHQLTGYAWHYFGRSGKLLAAIILLVGQWGALVAYLAGMGDFLALLVGWSGGNFWASLVVFLLGVLIMLRGLRLISELEGVISFFLIAMVVGLSILGLDKIQLVHLFSPPFSPPDLSSVLALYGVILGALSGWAILPEVVATLKAANREPRRLERVVGRVIWVGVLVPALVYALFQFTVVGISGPATSEEAILGLQPFFNPWIVKAGAVFGFFAMGTSFLTLAYSLRDMFNFDFDLKPSWAISLTLLPPLLIFLLGLRSFIRAFELTGIWIGTLSMIFIFALFLKSKFSSLER